MIKLTVKALCSSDMDDNKCISLCFNLFHSHITNLSLIVSGQHFYLVISTVNAILNSTGYVPAGPKPTLRGVDSHLTIDSDENCNLYNNNITKYHCIRQNLL